MYKNLDSKSIHKEATVIIQEIDLMLITSVLATIPLEFPSAIWIDFSSEHNKLEIFA